jgi:uncharacterized lipoprotein
MRRAALVLAAACVFALAACSGEDEPEADGELDASARTACDRTAEWSADGYPEDVRDETLQEIADAAAASDIPEIQAPSDEIAAAVGGSATAYQAPLDELASACMDLGWEG